MQYPGFHTTRFETPEKRGAAAALSKTERQEMISTLLYPYPHFVAVRDEVVGFHRPVVDGMPDRGKIGGLLGDPRAGKTCVLQSYARTVPAFAGLDGVKVPVVFVPASFDWDEAGLSRSICEAIGMTPPKGSTGALQNLALRRLKLAETTLLIIDDAHVIFQATNRRRKMWLGAVKAIADAKFCNVLLSGLPFIEDPMRQELQLAGRGAFHSPSIKSFAQTRDEFQQYQRFLHGIDERLPFINPSDLATKYVAELMRYSEGSVGWTMNLVEAAAYHALNADAGSIGIDHFKRAAATRANSKGYIAFAGA